MQKMQIHGVNLDVMTNQPVVILKDDASKRFLPIWIGQFEATSILMELQGVKPSRPLTHDLLKSMMEHLSLQLDKVIINDIKDGTFFAQIYFKNNREKINLDARPSDAIALAVRVQAPIYVTDNVVEKASIVSEEGEEDEVNRFRDFLENVSPEDFKDQG